MTTIHFAHANGFPAGTYQTLFNALPSSWRILANLQFGHKPDFPVAGNWAGQVDELIAYLDSSGVSEPVWLVGHSFGAVVSFMAACRYPQRVRGLVMLDPPLIYGLRRYLVKSAKLLNMMDSITPSKLAKIRRTHWHKDDDLEAYFAAKSLFKAMDERCIRDYVTSASKIEGDKRRLTFSRDVEADIFRHFPHDLKRYAGKLQCPALLLAGSQSKVTRPSERSRFAKDNGIKVDMFPGGHMFPLEKPEEVAATITATIENWMAG